MTYTPPPSLDVFPMESTKTLTDLPLDIQIAIISKLPVKTILACKCLSKPLNKLISDPLFSFIYYRTNYNNSSSLSSIFINSYDFVTCHITTSRGYKSDQGVSLDRDEFRRDIYDNSSPYNATLCNQSTKYSICGNCNGLICLLKEEFCINNFLVANPITGELIKLADPVSNRVLTYGLGYCEFTCRYKALRITTPGLLGDVENKIEILTIGVDENWKSVLDVDVPYDIYPDDLDTYTHPCMVALCSAIHWLVQPIRLSSSESGGSTVISGPNWEYRGYICAFDMTEERVGALPLPPRVVGRRYGLGVILEKLCFWELLSKKPYDICLWVMDEYGVEESWTKRFVLKFRELPWHISLFRLTPLAMSVEEGVILLSDNKRLMVYDMVNNSVKIVHHSSDANCTIPIVPDFVSFKNRQGWIIDDC